MTRDCDVIEEDVAVRMPSSGGNAFLYQPSHAGAGPRSTTSANPVTPAT